MPTATGRPGAVFDVDGTLVDSNYLHVAAWFQAFAANGHTVEMNRIHHLIGQGSERLVDSVLGRVDEAVVEAHSDFYGPWLYRLQAFDGAADLLHRCKRAGLAVVLATSASSQDVAHFRRALDADDAIDHVTTNDDADSSKPEPDIVEAALAAAGLAASDCVFVGDTVWDVEAANRAGMPCVCVLTGGIDAATLRASGAIEVYDSVGALLRDFDASPLATMAPR
jgi:HAD superfamily hydrolase (TIGR01509 family)